MTERSRQKARFSIAAQPGAHPRVSHSRAGGADRDRVTICVRLPGIAEGGLEDHWDRPDLQRPQPRAVVLGDRHTEVWREADDAQLGNELALGQETLRLPRELREDERL